jgi:hypothetical protein
VTGFFVNEKVAMLEMPRVRMEIAQEGFAG